MDIVKQIILDANWGFIAAAVVVSLVLGMLWYSEMVFGKKYCEWMGIKMNSKDMKKGMGMSLLWEAVSRVLYFLAIGDIFRGIPGDFWTAVTMTFMIWFLFIFSTMLSQVVWSPVDRRVLWITSTKILVETVLAAALWYFVFVGV